MGLQIKGAINHYSRLRDHYYLMFFSPACKKYVFERFVCNITNKAGKRVFFLSFKVGQSWYLEGEHRKKEQGNTIWYLGVDKSQILRSGARLFSSNVFSNSMSRCQIC
jgi:hypothetical protein